MLCTHVRRPHEINRTGINHDQICPLSKPTLHARTKNRVRISGVGANHHDRVGMLYRRKVLGAGAGAEGLLETVTGG